MSNIVWNAENGWHDGPEVSLSLDAQGRIHAAPKVSLDKILTDEGKRQLRSARWVRWEPDYDTPTEREAYARLGYVKG